MEAAQTPSASARPSQAILDAAIEHIKSKGVEVTPKKYACDDTYQAWIRDPNNVRIELFEYTDKSAQIRRPGSRRRLVSQP